MPRFVTMGAWPSMQHLPPELFERTWELTWYPFDFLPLAASAAAVNLVRTIEADKDFVALYGVRQVTDPANEATFVANVPMVVKIQSVKNDWPIDFLHIDNLFGTAQQPAIWPVGRLCLRSTELRMILTNLVATARNVRLAIGGFHVY